MANGPRPGLFIQNLDAKRKALGMDGQTFAAYLSERGASTSAAKWSRLVNGEHGYRQGWARSVCRVWPDLAAYAAADLLAVA
jgi:hypothetical protein